jgi:hypothetical protein
LSLGGRDFTRFEKTLETPQVLANRLVRFLTEQSRHGST